MRVKPFHAEIAQLVEHNLAKVGVASSSLVFRSKTGGLIIQSSFFVCQLIRTVGCPAPVFT